MPLINGQYVSMAEWRKLNPMRPLGRVNEDEPADAIEPAPQPDAPKKRTRKSTAVAVAKATGVLPAGIDLPGGWQKPVPAQTDSTTVVVTEEELTDDVE